MMDTEFKIDPDKVLSDLYKESGYSGKLYYSIGDVSCMLGVSQSQIRFWEKEFNIVIKNKNKKGNRLFTRDDIQKFEQIYRLLKKDGYTIIGAKEVIKSEKKQTLSDSRCLKKNIDGGNILNAEVSCTDGAVIQGSVKFEADLIDVLMSIKSELERLKESL